MQKLGIITRTSLPQLYFSLELAQPLKLQSAMAKIVVGFTWKGNLGKKNTQAIGPSRPTWYVGVSSWTSRISLDYSNFL